MNIDLIQRLLEHVYWVDGVEIPDPLSTEAADALIAAKEENERLKTVMERLACRHVTQSPLWWQEEARAALDGLPI